MLTYKRPAQIVDCLTVFIIVIHPVAKADVYHLLSLRSAPLGFAFLNGQRLNQIRHFTVSRSAQPELDLVLRDLPAARTFLARTLAYLTTLSVGQRVWTDEAEALDARAPIIFQFSVLRGFLTAFDEVIPLLLENQEQGRRFQLLLLLHFP